MLKDIIKDSINKLITLDAQIKKESIKKFDNNLISSPKKSFNIYLKKFHNLIIKILKIKIL